MATQMVYSTYTTIAVTSWAASLLGGEKASSELVDNTTNKYLDALVSGAVVFGASHVDGDVCSIYAYANYDTGTGTDNTGGIGTAFASGDAEQVEGTDITLRNMPLIAVVTANAASSTEHWGPVSVAAAFGGVLPEKWGLLIHNEDASAALGGACNAGYTGIKYEDA